ncbi:MAG: porin [Colwellia sp.]|nr:porin [Colwellia sp.]
MLKLYKYIFSLFLLLIPLGTAIADASFYGIFDISSQQFINSETNNELHTKSNGSRAGVKAKFEVNDDLSWLIQVESAVDYNSALDTQTYFSARNTFIGLQGSWGRLIMGKNDSPLKLSQGNIDLFTDTDVQIYALHEGDNRITDTIIFNSNTYNGFSLNYGLVKNGSKDLTSVGHSISLQYRLEHAYVAVAYDNNVLNQNIVRLVSEVAYQKINFGLLLQKANIINKITSYGFMLSMQYSLPQYLLKFQYSNSDDKVEGGRILTAGIEWLATDNLAVYTLMSDSLGDEIASEKLISLGVKYRF